MEDRFRQEADALAKNSLKYRCQVAYEDYFKLGTHQEREEYIVMKVCFRVKKQGVNWTYGEIADYQLKSPKHTENMNLIEALKSSSRKVRLMMPPENFNVFGNKLSQYARFSNSSSGSNDRNSTASGNSNNFTINGLI
jgi:hypothetical protein